MTNQPKLYMYGDSGEIFEPDLLLREVLGMEVDWFEKYANNPRIVLKLAKDNNFPYFNGNAAIFKELPLPGAASNIYYAPHPTGFVSYYSHKGDPNYKDSGFGGAPFDTLLNTGERKVLIGPWSSRAACVNIAVGENTREIVADVVACCRYRIGAAIKVEALKHLARHYKFPYYILRSRTSGREQGPIICSMRGDDIVKPNGARSLGRINHLAYEIFYQPKEEAPWRV